MDREGSVILRCSAVFVSSWVLVKYVSNLLLQHRVCKDVSPSKKAQFLAECRSTEFPQPENWTSETLDNSGQIKFVKTISKMLERISSGINMCIQTEQSTGEMDVHFKEI